LSHYNVRFNDNVGDYVITMSILGIGQGRRKRRPWRYTRQCYMMHCQITFWPRSKT